MSCFTSCYPVYSSEVRTTISPEGDRGFVAIQRLVTTAQAGTPARCKSSLVVPYYCAPYTTTTELAAPTEIHEVDLLAGTRTLRWTIPERILQMGLSERDDEMVATEGTYRPWYTFTHDIVSGTWNATSVGTYAHTCSITFRDVQRPTSSGAVHRGIPVEAAAACAPSGTTGMGTITPRTAGAVIAPTPGR